MSTVYYCEGGIALKSMGDVESESTDQSQNSDGVAIYKNDLTVLSALGHHPYIVQLYDTADLAQISTVSQSGQKRVELARNCQVLEAVHGGELFYHIVRHGPFSRQTARGLTNQIIDGVSRIHDLGYIHRDLKPWNIVMSDDHSQVKIIDFGLATPLDPSRREAPFTTFLPGTRQYMAPEIIVREQTA